MPKIHKRNCPQCNKEITYTRSSGLFDAEKSNSLCKACNYTPMVRTCVNCNKDIHYATIRAYKAAETRGSKTCGDCYNYEYGKNYQQIHKDRLREKTKTDKILNPYKWKDRYRRKDLKRYFGITIEEYNQMFNAQNGCCAICRKHQSEFKRNLAVDHCHLTGQIRGLLCGECNTGLGKFKDNLELLDKAKEYLKNNNSNNNHLN